MDTFRMKYNRLGRLVAIPEREAEQPLGNTGEDSFATAGSRQNGDGSEWYFANGPGMPFSTVPAPRTPTPTPRTTSPVPRTPTPAPRSPSPGPLSPSSTLRLPTPPPPQRGPVRPSSPSGHDGRRVDVERMMGTSTERTDCADPQLDDWNSSRANPFFDGPRTFHPHGYPHYNDDLLAPITVIARIINHNHRLIRMAPDGQSDDDDDDDGPPDLLYTGDGLLLGESEPGHSEQQQRQQTLDDEAMDGIEYEIERLNVRDVAADGPAPCGGGGLKRSRSSDDQDDEPSGRRVRRS